MKQDDITRQIKILALPLAGILGVLVLSYIGIRIFISRYKTLSVEKKSLVEEIAVLEEKSQILSSLGEDAENFTQKVVIGVPTRNPAPLAIYQFKKYAAQSGVEIVEIDSKSSGTAVKGSTAGSVKVDLSIQGAFDNVFSFLSLIYTFAPISQVDAIKLNSAEGLVRAEIQASSFWAPLPEKIPSITEKVEGLTEDEKKTLAKILKLTAAPVSGDSQAESVIRENPFSLE